MIFPDQSHINHVRDALWQRSEGASIMVGAGFTRNADLARPGARRAPTWRDLGQAMCRRLYPVDDRRRKRVMEEASGASGLLKLAQEYETAFGRGQLHTFLELALRPDDLRPSRRHQRLLRLPWRDVLTTNWDTLLERTCPSVVQRNFSVVQAMDHISWATTPRIIKLHGTIPGSERNPLILTEEDYRTYPTRFAPLVNTVQQLMMETTLLLIGFSGDDPNFLAWSGWVRDNLGASAPKIYLAGWLDLSPHRRSMLEQRGVVPVDLVLHPRARDWPDNLRHERATDWIISTLEHGEPYDISKWPEPPDSGPPAPPEYLEPIQKAKPNAPLEELYPPSMECAADERLAHVRDALSVWRHNRDRYPGWIVAPARARSTIVSYTREWMRFILGELHSLSALERLNTISEVIWRHEIVLEVISTELEAAALDALNSINCEARSIDGNYDEEADWSDIRKSWLLIAQALVATARLHLDREAFEKRLKSLEHFVEDSEDVAHRINHEKCLWELYSLDLKSLTVLLSQWETADCDPVWMMRKAALLFETDQVEEAKQLVEAALAAIRRAPSDDDSLALESREGWALYSTWDLYNLRNHEVVSAWERLTPVKCNALMEKQHIIEALRGRKERSAIPSFDVGMIREPGIELSNWAFYQWTAARRALRLPEIVGLPSATRGVAAAADLLKAGSDLVAPYEPELATRIILKVADFDQDKQLESIITRSRVAGMAHDAVASLAQDCITLIEDAWPRFSGADRDHRGFWLDRLRVAMEGLSRLVVRLEPETSGAFFDRVLGWYVNGGLSWHSLLNVPFGNLLRRSWETLPDETKRDKVLSILAAPIPGIGTSPDRPPDSPDPGALLRNDLVRPSRPTSEEEKWEDVVETLVRALTGTGETRQRASTRIAWMSIANLLSDSERAAVATALWGSDYTNQELLPEGTALFEWAFMLLPEPEPGLARTRFHERWLTDKQRSGEEAPTPEDILWNVGAAVANLRIHDLSLEMSDVDRKYLGEIVTAWAKTSVPRALNVAGASQPIYEGGKDRTTRNAVAGLQYILLEVEVSRTTGNALFEKVRKLNETRMPGFALMPGLARALPHRLDDIAFAMRMGLASDNGRLARNAATGLLLWLESSSNPALDVCLPPTDLVREIGVAIAVRRTTMLETALEVAKWIFVSGDDAHKSAIAELVSEGLGYLLEYLRYDREQEPDTNVPSLRWGCTHLAIAMANNGFGDGAAVVRWIENAKSDPLSEVRNARLSVSGRVEAELSGDESR